MPADRGALKNALDKIHSRADLNTSQPQPNRKLTPPTGGTGFFPNEASFLRLVSAILAEVSDEWETGKIHLNMENQSQPSI